MARVLIAVPTFENIAPETFKAIYGLRRPMGCLLMFDYVRGYCCARARNMIADEALRYGFDYVLMVDADIIVPAGTLEIMLKDRVDVCLGCYPRRNTENGTFELFKNTSKDYIETFSFDELNAQKGKIDVKGGGFGCALVRTEVFKKLDRPYFRYVEYDTGEVLSEDNYFCGKAREAGFKVQADTGVMCGHRRSRFQWR